MMGAVGRLGRVLGPKGLDAKPKKQEPLQWMLQRLLMISKQVRSSIVWTKANIIHVPVGKASLYSAEQLNDNFNTLMDAIIKAKPSSAKGQYLRSVTVTSTMGPGVKVNTAKLA